MWTYTYNKRRLLTKESLAYASKTYNILRGYDANGSLSQLTYPDSASTLVTFAPNALGESTLVGSQASAVRYHPNGAIASFTYGNGIAHTLEQNVRGLPYQATDAGVLNDRYSYDQNGNVTGITDLQEGITTRSMTYDDLDMLKTANAPNLWGNGSYFHDLIGNLRDVVITGGANARHNTINYNATTNRVDNMTGPAGTITFAYDSQGNITQRGADAFVFDQGNRLSSATGKASYVYDGHGRRVKTTKTDGTTQISVYGLDGQLLYGNTAVGAATPTESKYVYLGGTLLSEVGVAYSHNDGLGSPIARTNGAGGIVSRTRYEPYGYVTAGTTPTIGYTGHVNDAYSGLVYMQQRYYDPLVGRFMSMDPVLTDANTGASFNRYNYANSNPYRYIDPDGRFSSEDCRAMVGNCSDGTANVVARDESSTAAKAGAVVGGIAGGAIAAGCDFFTFGACVGANVPIVIGGAVGGAIVGGAVGGMAHSGTAALARAMSQASDYVKPKYWSTHHVVAQDDVRAAFSRIILGDAGMNINDANNGIFMHSRYHDKIHTDVYHAAVYGILQGASSYVDVAARLSMIKIQINSD